MQAIDSLAKFGRNHLEWHLRITGSRIPGSRPGKSRRQFVADLPVQVQKRSDAFQRMLLKNASPQEAYRELVTRYNEGTKN